MMIPGTVSAHRVIGTEIGQYAQMVDDDKECWAAEEDNRRYLQIELCQPTYDDPFSDWQYETAATVVQAWATQYSFALIGAVIVAHSDTAQGKRNGKSDPGDLWDWERFWTLLNERENDGENIS